MGPNPIGLMFLFQRGHLGRDRPGHREGNMKTQEKTASCLELCTHKPKTPAAASAHRKLAETKVLPQNHQRAHGPAGTTVPGFQPPESRNDTFLEF